MQLSGDSELRQPMCDSLVSLNNSRVLLIGSCAQNAYECSLMHMNADDCKRMLMTAQQDKNSSKQFQPLKTGNKKYFEKEQYGI